jgi:hypothetical protein
LGNKQIIFALLISTEIFITNSNDFMVNITQDDLLKYLYKESSAEQTQYIQQLLETDSELQERFHLLKTVKGRLNQIKLISPNSRSVDNILNYAERAVEELHQHN